MAMRNKIAIPLDFFSCWILVDSFCVSWMFLDWMLEGSIISAAPLSDALDEEDAETSSGFDSVMTSE